MAELKQNANWSEAEHPRDNDGKFAGKESSQSRFEREQEKQEQRTRKWTADSTPRFKTPVAQGFNRSNTKSHLAHAKEMGLNEKQYIKAAEDFFNNESGEKFSSSKRGRFYKYDSHKQTCAVVGKDGSIHTFFKVKPKDFEKIIKQDGLEKI